MAEQLEWQPHNVGQASFDVVNEGVSILSYGVGAGFVTPNAAFDVCGDLRVSQFLRVNDGRIGFDDLQAATLADKRKAGNDLVGFAEQHLCYRLGVFCVNGFADNSAIEINNGICADDK